MIDIRHIRSLLRLMEDMQITSIPPDGLVPTLMEISLLDIPEPDYEFNYVTDYGVLDK